MGVSPVRVSVVETPDTVFGVEGKETDGAGIVGSGCEASIQAIPIPMAKMSTVPPTIMTSFIPRSAV
jgi:hypothetical protein